MNLLSDGTSSIVLDIGWNSSTPDSLIMERSKTVGGKDSFTVYGKVKRFELETKWVPSSDAALVNQWWEFSTPLSFFFDLDQTSYDCILVSTNQPFYRSAKPYNDLFSGMIALEMK